MLPRSSTCRYAAKRNPERERRLLLVKVPEIPAENPEGPEAEPPGLPDTVHDLQNLQRETLHKAVEKEKSAYEVMGKLDKTQEHMRLLSTTMKERRKSVGTLSSEKQSAWEYYEKTFEKGVVNLEKAKELANVFATFSHGEMSPGEFTYKLQRFSGIDGLDDTSNALREMVGRRIAEELSNRSEGLGGKITWETANVETRATIARAVLNEPEAQVMLSGLEQLDNQWSEVIKQSKIEDMLLELTGEERYQEMKAEQGSSPIRDIMNATGTGIFTVGDFWGGLKLTWEAFTKAWERRGTIRQAMVARLLAPIAELVPGLGPAVKQELYQNLEDKEHGEQEVYFKYLDSVKANYKHVRNFLQENSGDYNRLRGALKYAASRGWIYEFFSGDQPRMLMGVSISSITQQMTGTNASTYLTELKAMNESGSKKEIEHAKDRERLNNSLVKFEHALRAELEEMNLWGAVGVIQAAIARGRSGETGGVLTAIFTSHLRTHPELAKREELEGGGGENEE